MVRLFSDLSIANIFAITKCCDSNAFKKSDIHFAGIYFRKSVRNYVPRNIAWLQYLIWFACNIRATWVIVEIMLSHVSAELNYVIFCINIHLGPCSMVFLTVLFVTLIIKPCAVS